LRVFHHRKTGSVLNESLLESTTVVLYNSFPGGQQDLPHNPAKTAMMGRHLSVLS
jgi:hypothetical protein